MTTLGPSRRVSKRRSQVKIRSKIDVVDLNSPPIVSHELELSSGSALLQLSQGTPGSMNSHHIHPTGQHRGSAAPSNDAPNSFVIDVEEIEDEVQLLSSSRGFHQARNLSRRNRPLTVFLDEELDTDPRSGYYLNQAYQYRYNLATNDNLLVALRNVILRLQANRELVDEAINESRLFREGYGSFADPFAISCRYKMDAVATARSSGNKIVINCDLYPDLQDENSKGKKVIESVQDPPKQPTFSCPICMNTMTEASSTICGHIFCKSCIVASIQAQKKCPTCRRKLNMNNFHRVYLPNSD